jgi:serine/threonine-protein kinase
MKPERWQQIKAVFEEAVQLAPAERQRLLDRVCAGDHPLQVEVDAMLAADDRAASFIERPIAEVEPELFGEPTSVSRIGSRLGDYVILSRLGAGGMGEVYLAEDSRLGRKVALKVLTPASVTNAASSRRFLREARLASALDHPNICTIYEAGAADGRSFISMQYVEGETLREALRKRPVSVERLVSIALQVADALAAAHAHGIVHRDITSSNIMLTPRGQAKVLDFGIAKSLQSPVESAGGSQLTGTGAVFGTPGYLSPEQARGQPVDHRSDIFSFGVVLYEMATGCPPFSEPSAAETMNAVINVPHPPLSASDPPIPPALVTIIDRALAKDPAHRYRSMEEMRAELRHVAQAIGLVSAGAAEAGLDPGLFGGAVVDGATLSRRPRLKRTRLLLGAAGLALVLVAAISAAVAGRRTPVSSMGSVAVLPFDHESTLGDLEYLADGIGESVTRRLSHLPQLRVMARSTMSPYRGRSVDPRAVGRELGVDGVLTGQVVRDQNTVIVRLELVDARDGARLWGEEYRRPYSELSALPGDLALAVSRQLHVRLLGQQEQTLARDYTRSADAYEQYLKGRYFWNKRTAETVTRAIDYFQSAIHKDPSFALAYSGLADSYLVLRGYGIRSPEQTIPQARAAAERAVTLDDSIAEAHTSLGQVRTHYRDWTGAEAAFARAIELNPGYATAHHWQAMHLANLGRLDEAIAAIRRAQALDPLSLIINTEAGRLLYFSRQYDAAVAQYSRTLEMDPNFALAHGHLGTVLVAKGLYTEAIAEFERAESARAPIALVGRIRAYALSGRRDEALRFSQRMLPQLENGFAPPYAMAVLSVSLRDYDGALAWLEKGTEGTYFGAWFLKVDPVWDVLRPNPRFQAVVRRAGLAP